MAEVMKKELLLEGLNCNKCLDEIANSLNIKNIDYKLDYKNKNLSFKVSNDKEYDKVIKYVNQVLDNHKHQIKISETQIHNIEEKTLFIGKLTCSNCARKIESRVRNIAGVKSASLDFVNSKLSIIAKSKHDLEKAVEESKKIVRDIEPDATVIDKDEKSSIEEKEEGIVKETIFTLILGAIPFLLGMLLNLDFIYELGLFLFSYLIIGNTVIKKAINSILKGDIFNENTLMMIATVGAFFIQEYHEAIAVMAFYLVGEMFQDLAVDKSRKSISKLMDLSSDHANLLINDKIVKVKPEEVEVNSLIVVKPGEKIPLDGIVVDGDTYVDTASITGEATPRFVEKDSQVLSGFINLNEALTIKTNKKYNDSTVNKIIEMVENASSRKAPTENFITKFARIYTPVVVFIAIILAIFPPLVLGKDFNTWLYRALSFLVVSCPCALVISVPLGFYGGIGFASRNGILIKGGNYLEALRKSEEIIFDKTGTLTLGKFVISKINAIDIDKEKLLEVAAYAEYYSIHPIAEVIKETYKKDIEVKRISKYQEIAGQGIEANIDSNHIIIGNELLLKNKGIDFIKNNSFGTILYIAINNNMLVIL